MSKEMNTSINRVIKLVGLFAMISLFVSACGSDGKNSPKDNGMGEFLPVEKAFMFKASRLDANTINAHWDIAEGYHLYKDKFEFALANGNYQISGIDMPKGKMIEDKVFGNKESYEGRIDVKISVKEMKPSPKTGMLTITTGYQGCSEKGLCYPPQSIQTEINLTGS